MLVYTCQNATLLEITCHGSIDPNVRSYDGCVGREGPDYTARLHKHVRAIPVRICDKFQNMINWLIFLMLTNYQPTERTSGCHF